MPASDQGSLTGRYTLIPRTLIFLSCGNRMLLIKGAPHKRLWANLYNGIGGHVERGEDILSAARRELQEEIGMAAKEFQYLGGFYLAPGYTDEFMSVFLATDLVESILEPDEDEFIEVSNLSTSEVFRKAFRGDFADGKTLAALFLAQPYLKSQGGNESS